MMFRALLGFILLASFCAGGGHAQVTSAQATAESRLEGPALLAALRRGGYVIYFRHTSTDFGQDDSRMTSYEDCATQRNLTDAGRAEARAIGASIRKLGIPVGDVLASPYCRTMETARLIFGRATPSIAVRGGPASNDGDRYAALKQLLAQRPPAGTNIAISSHGNPFRAVAGSEPYLAEGEAAIVEAQPGGGFRIVARIRKDGWDTLVPRTTGPIPAGQASG